MRFCFSPDGAFDPTKLWSYRPIRSPLKRRPRSLRLRKKGALDRLLPGWMNRPGIKTSQIILGRTLATHARPHQSGWRNPSCFWTITISKLLESDPAAIADHAVDDQVRRRVAGRPARVKRPRRVEFTGN